MIDMKATLLIIVLLGVCCGLTSEIGAAEVTYVASEAVYIDAGTGDGIKLGDSLRVYRHDSLQAVLIVTIPHRNLRHALFLNYTDLYKPETRWISNPSRSYQKTCRWKKHKPPSSRDQ